MMKLNRRGNLPYIDYRPAPSTLRRLAPSRTVTPLMRAGRALRALRERARVAVQMFACNRAMPGDAMAAYAVVIGTVVASLLAVLGAHMVAR